MKTPMAPGPAHNTNDQPTDHLSDLSFLGSDLYRPECVLCTGDGRVHVSDWRGGVTVIRPDGQQETVLAADRPWLRPNGIALEPDGSYLLAHLGDGDGGVYRLRSDGGSEPVVTAIDGAPLPPTNFPFLDRQGRLWITVSTRHQPRAAAYRRDIADGFIILVDSRGPRIVADNLGYTNECWVDPDGRSLFVNETFGRRLSRFSIAPDGALADRTTVAHFGPGTFPDGLAVDEAGHFWVTSIVSNRVIRVAPDGTQTVVLEDADDHHVARVEHAFLGGAMGRKHLDVAAGKRLANISSLAFGGKDRRRAVLGCLLGQSLAVFDAGVPGQVPVHWPVTTASAKSPVRA